MRQEATSKICMIVLLTVLTCAPTYGQSMPGLELNPPQKRPFSVVLPKNWQEAGTSAFCWYFTPKGIDGPELALPLLFAETIRGSGNPFHVAICDFQPRGNEPEKELLELFYRMHTYSLIPLEDYKRCKATFSVPGGQVTAYEVKQESLTISINLVTFSDSRKTFLMICGGKKSLVEKHGKSAIKIFTSFQDKSRRWLPFSFK